MTTKFLILASAVLALAIPATASADDGIVVYHHQRCVATRAVPYPICNPKNAARAIYAAKLEDYRKAEKARDVEHSRAVGHNEAMENDRAETDRSRS